MQTAKIGMVVGVLVLSCLTLSAASLSVTPAAAFGGSNFGLQLDLVPGNTTNALVQTNTPSAETTVRATFKVRPNPKNGNNWEGMPTPGSRFTILRAKKIGGAEAFRVMFFRAWTTSDFFIFVIAFEDNGSPAISYASPTFPVMFANTQALVTIEYQTASAPGANDGFVRLYQGTTLKGEVTGMDNDTRVVDFFDFGAFNQRVGQAPAADMDMVMHFDDFESFRTLAP
jgi:hypothetical protein